MWPHIIIGFVNLQVRFPENSLISGVDNQGGIIITFLFLDLIPVSASILQGAPGLGVYLQRLAKEHVREVLYIIGFRKKKCKKNGHWETVKSFKRCSDMIPPLPHSSKQTIQFFFHFFYNLRLCIMIHFF